MKNKTTVFLTVLYILTMGGHSQAQQVNSIYIKDIFIPGAKFIVDFTEIHRIVNKNYSLLEHKHIDPDSLFAKYAGKIESVSTNEEYGKALLEYFAELKNSHTTIYFNRYRHNCSARLVEGRIFIDQIDSENFKNAGIKLKDEIIEIDNVPVREWIKVQEKYISASTKEDRIERSVWSIFTSYYESSRKFLIKSQEGLKTVSIIFSQDNNRSLTEKSEIIECKLLSDSIGYIAINSMMGNVVKEFEKQYQLVKDLPTLIVDIRKTEEEIPVIAKK